jgi:diguanylate cyclase (GGDEF)-like protein
VDYLIKLADALSYSGSFDAAAERYAQAERLAAAIGDAERQIMVLNNLAYFACTAGQEQLAFAAVERLRAVAAADGRGLDWASSYLDTIAQVELALGRYGAAERAARAGIELYDADGYEDAEAAALFLLTLATAQRHLGDTGSAQHNLDRCRQLCDERDLAMVRIQVQQEQAELYAACGDLGRAFETYKAFHQADKALVSEQREARARTRQALFETTEARREADWFREQARRDPLTGLWNRRYLDEHLTPLIEHSVNLGAPLVVAIIDLDHFKQINDTYSHEAGDRVLVEVAGLLTAAVPTAATAFSARLGGEEFVAVLTGIGPAEAVDRLEGLRRTVAAHPWQHITGDHPVTVSIGVAVRTADSTQTSLLGRADAALYAAKNGGRNRVHVDPGTICGVATPSSN